MKTAHLSIYLEFYVMGKEEPLHWPMALSVTEEVTSVEQVMSFAHDKLEELLGKQKRMTITDERKNHYILMLDKVTAIAVLAPDPESIPWLEEESVSDEDF